MSCLQACGLQWRRSGCIQVILEMCDRWVDSTVLPVCIREKSSMAFGWIAQGVRLKWCKKLEYLGPEGRAYQIFSGSSIEHCRFLHFPVDVWKGQAARRDSVDRATTTAGVVGVNGFESPRSDIVEARKTCHWHDWRRIRIHMQRRCQIQTK